MEMEAKVEVQVEGDAEKHVGVEPELDQLDDYPGGQQGLTVLTMYLVHVARMAADGVVRRYTFY